MKIKGLIKKYKMRHIKKDINYIPRDTQYGKLDISIISGSIYNNINNPDYIYSNIILSLEFNISNEDMIKDINITINTISKLGFNIGEYCKDNMKLYIISGSIHKFKLLKLYVYEQKYELAYIKGLKSILNYLQEFQIFSEYDFTTSEDLNNKIKYYSLDSSNPIFIEKIEYNDEIINLLNFYNIDTNDLLYFLIVQYNYEGYISPIYSILDFIYNYNNNIINETDYIENLLKLIPDVFVMPNSNGKNIFDINLNNNNNDSDSSLYDEIDEIIE